MTDRHYLITAEEIGNYGVIAGGLPDFGPDGLYVVRNGIAVAVTAEQLAPAAIQGWDLLDEEAQRKEIREAQEAINDLIEALTRPADGADA